MEGKISDKLHSILNDPKKAEHVIPAIIGGVKNKYFKVRKAEEKMKDVHSEVRRQIIHDIIRTFKGWTEEHKIQFLRTYVLANYSTQDLSCLLQDMEMDSILLDE